MTAITTTASALAQKDAVRPPSAARESSFPPSASEEEAKTRFASALSEGVAALSDRGHGLERASAELLGELTDACSPDEDEIFQTMEALGISLEDATKVMTVSSAFRNAQTAKCGSTLEAIDVLTSRLNLADLSHKGGRSRSSSPSPSAAALSVPPAPPGGNLKIITEPSSRNGVVDSFQTRPLVAVVAKNGQRPVRAAVKSHGPQARGRKRALAEKTPEPSNNANVMLGEPTKKVAAGDLEVKEKILNAKLSKPKSSARAKSPEALGPRGKRAAGTALHVEDSQANKRPRTRSQTEESIPAIMS